MFCTNCGKEITDDSEFCPACGKSVKESTAEQNSLESVIGKNSGYYIREFEKVKAGEKTKFNWAAFFFSILFCLYRKCGDLFKKYFLIPVILIIIAGILAAIGSNTFSLSLLAIGGVLSVLGVLWVFISCILLGKRFNSLYFRHCTALLGTENKKKYGTSILSAALFVIFLIAITGVLSFVSMSGFFISFPLNDVNENEINEVDYDAELEPSVESSEALEHIDLEVTPTADSEKIISDFLETYAIYRTWIQGRTSTTRAVVDETDPITGSRIYNGLTLSELLGTVFSQRYAVNCMTYLGVSEADAILNLPLPSGTSYDMTRLNPDYELTMTSTDTCSLHIHWNEDGTDYNCTLDGLWKNGRWIFDDYTDSLAEGQYGLFGSYREPSSTSEPVQTTETTPIPTEVPLSNNTAVVSLQYIANVPSAAYLLRTPDSNSDVLETLYLGTEVGFIENANSIYAKVKYGNIYGYVNQKYLSSTEPETLPPTVTPPMSSYRDLVSPDSIWASSVLYDNTSFTYDAENVNDHYSNTSWVEGVSGTGIGEYLAFSIPAGTVIPRVYVVPGYCSSESLFYKNAAPTCLEVSSGDQSFILDLYDIANSYEASIEGIEFTLEGSLISDGTVYVTILDVREGSVYEDTSISEFWFYRQ